MSNLIFFLQKQAQQQEEKQQLLPEDLQQEVYIRVRVFKSINVGGNIIYKLFVLSLFMAVILILHSNILYQLLFLSYSIFGGNTNFW